MADPASYRPKAIPTDPGVYRFQDGEGRVLYVGKAKNLRARLSSYFQDPAGLSPRIRKMVYTAEAVQWVVVASEVEALTLEYSWINEFNPRYNVVFRDSKSYPYLAVSVREEFPQVWVTRQRHRKGTKYLGPYTKVWAIRETLDQLLSVFPVRSCTNTQFKQAQRAGRPCLFGHIGKCSAPCVGRIEAEDYAKIVDRLVDFVEGGTGRAIAERKKIMVEAAASQEYERAARLRDEIQALEAINERNTVVFDENLDADIFGIAFDELEASVQVFYVRGGRIRGQQAWVSDEISGLDAQEVVSFLLLQVYGSAQFDEASSGREDSRSVDDREHTPLSAIPYQIWVPEIPADRQELEAWLAERRGRPVRLKSPKRGDKARLAETVRLNALQTLQRHKLARAGDITVRSQALKELSEALDLERAPLRIECFDVSHTQGTHQVASMVVFEDGMAKKSDYRHYIVRGPDGKGAADDTAAMDEVLRRRLTRLVAGAAGDDAGGAEDEAAEAAAAENGPLVEAGAADAAAAGAGDVAAAAAAAEDVAMAAEDSAVADGPVAGAGAAAAAVAEADAEDVATTHAADKAGEQAGSSGPAASAAKAVPRSTGAAVPRRFAYRPDLIVVDGGLPQVNAAAKVVEETGADVAVVGLAKRLEEVWVPGEDFPVILPRTSPALRLLQQLRDESHRFAITFHRKKRSQAMTRSALDAVQGLGPAKQKALLSAFGSLAKIRAASAEELESVPGIGPALASAIVAHFGGAAGGRAADEDPQAKDDVEQGGDS